EARQRTANPSTLVQIPSPPLTWTPPKVQARAIGAVIARFLDTEEAASSIIASSTSSPAPTTYRRQGGSSDAPTGDSWAIADRVANFVLLAGLGVEASYAVGEHRLGRPRPAPAGRILVCCARRGADDRRARSV